jgi:hypothetical protein
MENKNNVIDLAARRATGSPKAKAIVGVEPSVNPGNSATPVVDITERRMEILRQDRRAVKRTILSEFVGAFAVIPSRGLCKVAIYDISEKGIAFDMDLDMGAFRVGEEVAMRIYLNQVTYFPFFAQITNVREIADEGVHRFGATFVKDSINDQALVHFVKFVENVSASLKKDGGDVLVSGLRR